MHLALVLLPVASIVIGEWMPGSLAATLARYAFLVSITMWFGLRIRTGYRRRRPYWTRESWLRYLRLAAMPVAATIFVLAMSTDAGIQLARSAPSAARPVLATLLVLMLLIGAFGLGTAVDWLTQGPPSDQFTRRGWFGRRGSSATAQ